MKRPRCKCTCQGCKTPGTHCLNAPCTLTKNRRTPAQIAADARYSNGRALTPQRTNKRAEKQEPEPQAEPVGCREEWFVFAHKRIDVKLAAPEGESEALGMARALRSHGWSVGVHTENVPRGDHRFHPLQYETSQV
jgi:hypothetical protein